MARNTEPTMNERLAAIRSFALFLLTPEDSGYAARPLPRTASPTAGAAKAMFWLAAAILLGLLAGRPA